MSAGPHRLPRNSDLPSPLRVAQVGLGDIGRASCRVAADRRGLRLVGAADPAPGIRGQDLGALVGIDLGGKIEVRGSIEELLDDARPQVVIHTTGSRIAAVAPQLEEILSRGVSCVTSAEEMLLPDFRDPQAAARLDEVARRNGAALVGTGVNPGFVLDLLPILMTGACRRVESLRAGRAVDLASRRPALRRKTGVGLTAEEFTEQAAARRMGHVGLLESAALICRVLGWDEGGLQESILPVLARSELKVGDAEVPAGRVRGNNHVVRLERDGRELLFLDLRMVLGEAEPGDWIEIRGEPDLEVRLPGGLPGDLATAAILVNTVPRIAAAPPGLHTILDLPPVRFSA
ncbi:MAG: dihydrodipicolinate reductase [Acidobacteria bacterium]|nr:dihydrodipicolinate reductase [Acidobacteriota bacterium]